MRVFFAGFPQGTVNGLTWWDIYSDDLMEILVEAGGPDCTVEVFADDGVVLLQGAFWHPAWRRVGNLLNLHRDEDRRLQLFSLNEECLVGTSHQLVLITSLPFVHTARRCY